MGRPVKRAGRIRADLALVGQGLAPSRERARALILAGDVLDGDRPVDKAGDLVAPDAPLRLRGIPLRYVSRGGLKLEHALRAFAVDPAGAVALDVGSSTGGFTDCLLQYGAARVICVDVGYGQLHPRLRADRRVTVLERTHVRDLAPAVLGEPVDLVSVDVSFISLRLVLPVLVRLVRPGASLLALVKPQFEVGRGHVGKGGIVRDEAARLQAVASVAAAARSLGLAVAGETVSPITGAKGNVEHLLFLRASGEPG